MRGIWCVVLFVSVVYETFTTITTSVSLGQCARRVANSLPGDNIPRCTEDGRFKERQCHGSHCWCVSPDYGVFRHGSRRGPGEGEPPCPGDEPEDLCPKLEKVGCFHDSFKTKAERVFPNELVNRRDRNNNNFDGTLISWKAYTESVEGLACACAKAAKAKGWTYFGLQFFGECWSGPSLNPGRDGIAETCTGSNFKPCIDSDERKCIGKAKTNYVYKLKQDVIYHSPIDGHFSEWSSWSACSKTCGLGTRTRTRTCTNPAPRYGGHDCFGEATQMDPLACNPEPCKLGCGDPKDIGIILDASTSVTRENWNRILKFVNHLPERFMMDPELRNYGAMFGVIRFSWYPTMIFKFSDKAYWTIKGFQDKVSSIRYTHGRTRPDRALEMAERELMCATCGTRKVADKVLLVFTDGQPSEGMASLDKVTEGLKKNDVTIVAIGAGKVDRKVLNAIATDANHVMTLGDDYLSNETMNKFVKLLCNDKGTFRYGYRYHTGIIPVPKE